MASDICPVDYSLAFSQQLWLNHLNLVGDQSYHEAAPITIPMPTLASSTHTVEYSRAYALTSTGDKRYVCTIRDGQLGHEVPSWTDLATFLWTFFDDPDALA